MRRLLAVPHEIGQEGADRRDEGEQQDAQGQGDQIGDDRDGDALHRKPRYPRRHEQVDPERRRQHGDVVGHDQNDAEVDRVDAELEDHGQQHRDQNDDGRQRFHEHAEDVQHADDHQEHEVRIVGDAEHDGRQTLRGFLEGQYLAEQGGRAHDEQHRAAGHRAFEQGLVDVPGPERPVDHDAYEQRPHDGDHGSLNGRRPAGVDGTEDDEGRRQREPALAAALEENLQVEGRGVHVALEAVLLRQQIRGHDHREGDDEAGNESRREHGGHGQVAEDRVDDHRIGRRDQDADGAARGGRRGGVVLGVAVAGHGGDQDRAHGGDGSRPGARDGGEEGAGENGGDAEPAVDAAHKLLHHVHDLLRDVAELHQRARDHETGDGQEREQVQAVKERVVDDRQGQDVAPGEDGDHRGNDQGHEDGQSQQEHGHKDDKGNG